MVALLTGLAVTGLEVASARLLAPFFGSTIFVYGSAIGIALLALALGYALGGKFSDRYPQRGILAMIILFAGLTAGSIPLTFRLIAESVDRLGTTWNLPTGLLAVISMSILFLAPIMALGAVSPFILRLSLRRVEESGQWSGALSGLATAGSIIGTFVASFVTIPLLGTRETIAGAAAILLILGASLMVGSKRIRSIPLAVAVMAVVAGTSGPFLPVSGLLWESESPYQLVRVLERGTTRYMLFESGSGVQSVYYPSTPLTGTYYDTFALLPYLAQGSESRRSVLMIGLAGGSIARLYRQVLEPRFQFDLTGVEIDPDVLVAGRQFFDLDRQKVSVILDDARRYLRTTDQEFDVIIIDAYIHELNIPPQLATVEFFRQVQAHLAPGGIVGMNVVAPSASRFFPKFLATAKRVFPEVLAAPFESGAENQFVLAGQSIDLTRVPPSLDPPLYQLLHPVIPALRAVESSEQPVYTDNQTDIELRLST